MLYYNFKTILELRGITQPFGYLRKNGFSQNLSYRITSEETGSLHLKVIERLCKLLNCTPKDVLFWKPDKPEDDNPNHPLYFLKKDLSESYNIIKTMGKIPVSEAKRLIEELRKNKT